MLYHQTAKTTHCDRLSVLKKVEDKYDWEGVNFPVSFDDIQTFENNRCALVFTDTAAKEKSTRYG